MNETSTPHGAQPGESQPGGSQYQAPQQGAPQQAPFGTGFFTWIRGLGVSRAYDRWFAGVAGGIAHRANIDPIIVRGVFIVLSVLGGPGILLYLVGWLLLPDQGGKIHLEEVLRGRSGTAAVVATVAVAAFVVFPALSALFGIPFSGGWTLWNSFGLPHWVSVTLSVLLWVAGIVAAIAFGTHLLVRHGRSVREQRDASQGTQQHSFAGAPPQGGTQGSGAQGAPTAQFDEWTERISSGAEKFGERANAWGEEVGRQADEWSARYASEYDRHRLGAAHVVITLALALLAAGGAALWGFAQGMGTGTVLIGALLGATAVFALSLIVAGVRGRHSGWVGLLAASGVIALCFTAILPHGTRVQPFGNMSIGSESPGAVLIAGTSKIDIDSFTRDYGTGTLEVWQGFGSSTITLPTTTPVVLNVRLLGGSLSASDSRSAGPLLFRTIDTRANKSDDAPTVTVTLLAGSIDVVGSAEPRVRTSSTAEAGRINAPDETSSADLERELRALLEEQSTVQAELGDPLISDTRKARLESTLDQIGDEIADTREELVR